LWKLLKIREFIPDLKKSPSKKDFDEHLLQCKKPYRETEKNTSRKQKNDNVGGRIERLRSTQVQLGGRNKKKAENKTPGKPKKHLRRPGQSEAV